MLYNTLLLQNGNLQNENYSNEFMIEYQRYLNICLSLFNWNNLPESIRPEFIEETLFIGAVFHAMRNDKGLSHMRRSFLHEKSNNSYLKWQTNNLRNKELGTNLVFFYCKLETLII